MKMRISKLVVVINNPFKRGRLQAETMLTAERDAILLKVSLVTCPSCHEVCCLSYNTRSPCSHVKHNNSCMFFFFILPAVMKNPLSIARNAERQTHLVSEKCSVAPALVVVAV